MCDEIGDIHEHGPFPKARSKKLQQSHGTQRRKSKQNRPSAALFGLIHPTFIVEGSWVVGPSRVAGLASMGQSPGLDLGHAHWSGDLGAGPRVIDQRSTCVDTFG